MSSFAISLIATGEAIAKLLIISLFGYIFVKLKALSTEGVRSLSQVVISFALPCLIFSNIINRFDPAIIPRWWSFPLGGITWSLSILAFGYGISSLLKLGKPERDLFSVLLAFQNASYIPVPLAAALLPPEWRETVFVYIFLLAMGISPLMWSLGAGLIFGQIRGRSFSLSKVITPPFIATLLAVLLVLGDVKEHIPGLLLEAISLSGSITVPLIMFSLGGIIALIKPQRVKCLRGIAFLLALKLIVIPGIALFAVHLLHLPYLLGFFIILQAASPPATGLAVIGNYYQINSSFIDQAILFSYILIIITIPSFISAFTVWH